MPAQALPEMRIDYKELTIRDAGAEDAAQLAENLAKFDTKEVSEKLDRIANGIDELNAKIDSIDARVEMLEAEYAEVNGYETVKNDITQDAETNRSNIDDEIQK